MTRAAVLEQIEPDFGSSMRLMYIESVGPQCPHFWHYHPEFELVYIDRGAATRHIGNHIDRFEDGDLIMVGSNLPHRGFTEDMVEDHTEIILQWHPDCLGKGFFNVPEMVKVAQLLERCQYGLSFYGETRTSIGAQLETLAKLEPSARLQPFLAILSALADSEEYRLLNASGVGLKLKENDLGRIKNIYAFVDKYYQQKIELDKISAAVNMTKPAFCRYFKKVTGLTFMTFVNKYRVAKAARELSNTDRSISMICYDIGFFNLSTFNKQFKKITGMTPLNYRKSFWKKST